MGDQVGRTLSIHRHSISPDEPARAHRRWRLLLLSLVAAATMMVPALLAAPAHAVDGGTQDATAPVETDDDGKKDPDGTTPPPTETEPPVDATVALDPLPSLIRQDSVTVSGTVPDSIEPGSTVTVKSQGRQATNTSVTDSHTFSADIEVAAGEKQKITASVDGAKTAEAFVNVLFAPSITQNEIVAGIGENTVSGTGYKGAKLTLTVGERTYSTTVKSDRSWTVTVAHEVSRGTATATQTTSWAPEGSNASRSIPITVDLTAPKPPALSSPAAGTTLPLAGATISGTAEPGAQITVFVGAQAICKATASSSGAWSCTASEVYKSGKGSIVAIATDAVGNSSKDSNPVSVRFGSASKSPSDPPTTDSPSDAPTDEETTPDEKTEEPSPSESDESHSKAAPPAPADPRGPWNHATPFTDALPPALGAEAIAGWARALLLAALTVGLILIPARMLAGTFGRRRVAASAVTFTGRNRSSSEFEMAPSLAVPSRVAMIVIGIVGTGALAIFANPVDGRPAYLRLLIASVLAAALINAVAAWVPRILSHVWRCGYTEVRFNPRWLMLVAASVLATRLFDMHPALLFGLVTTVRVPSVLADAVLARLALTRMGGVFATGMLAWMLAALVPQGGGFFTQLVIETANITALVGIGSAAIMMVPLGRLSGRAIFAWSRPLWLGSVLAILTALFVMLGPTIESWRTTGNVLAALALVLAFAALGITLWLWRRFVQPMLTSS